MIFFKGPCVADEKAFYLQKTESETAPYKKTTLKWNPFQNPFFFPEVPDVCEPTVGQDVKKIR